MNGDRSLTHSTRAKPKDHRDNFCLLLVNLDLDSVPSGLPNLSAPPPSISSGSNSNRMSDLQRNNRERPDLETAHDLAFSSSRKSSFAILLK